MLRQCQAFYTVNVLLIIVLSFLGASQPALADCVTTARQALPTLQAAYDALKRGDDAAYCALVPELLRSQALLSREVRAPGCPAGSDIVSTITRAVKDLLRSAPKYCKQHGGR